MVTIYKSRTAFSQTVIVRYRSGFYSYSYPAPLLQLVRLEPFKLARALNAYLGDRLVSAFYRVSRHQGTA
jgi:hypothetical protein